VSVASKGKAQLSLAPRSSIVLVLDIDLIVTREKRRKAKATKIKNLRRNSFHEVVPRSLFTDNWHWQLTTSWHYSNCIDSNSAKT
jgi:hypothetical protein